MVLDFHPKQDALPGLPHPFPLVDLGRVQRDFAGLLDEIRLALVQTQDLRDKSAVWWWLRESEAEMRHLTDLAGARVEKALEEM